MSRFTVPASLEGERLDVVVAQLAGITRSQAQKGIKAGLITIDGAKAEPKQVVSQGMSLVIAPPPLELPSAPELTVLYEDADIMAVDKPAGLVVHASETGRIQPTVAAFAAGRGVEDDDVDRPGIVHRLDKETSGVMLIAKHPAAKRWLQDQFKRRQVQKSYLALVRGRFAEPEALINLPIGRSRQQPIKRAVQPGARAAVTRYRVLREYRGASLVEVGLQTGRTHQIRVHFSHLGHPVVGDTLYGDTRERLPNLSRQFLHAAEISFNTLGGKAVTVKSPLPPELQNYLDGLQV